MNKPAYTLVRCLLLFASASLAESRTIEVTVEHGGEGVTVASIKSSVASEERTKAPITEVADVLKRATGYHSSVTVTIDSNDVVLGDYLRLLSAIAENHQLRLGYIGKMPKAPETSPEDIPYQEPTIERASTDPLSEERLIEAALKDARARHFLADLWTRNLLSSKAREAIVRQHLRFMLIEQFPHDPAIFPTLREITIIANTDFPFPETAWVEFSSDIAVGNREFNLPADSFKSSRSLFRCNHQNFASLGGSYAGSPIARGVIQMREIRMTKDRVETLWSIRRVTEEITLQYREAQPKKASGGE